MNLPWRLWASQVAAIVRLELKTSFSLRRALPVYLLASMQFIIFAGHSMAHLRGWQQCDGSFDLTLFAGVFQIFVLRLAVFFGCVVIFLGLFRGEVVQKSLHYYFLSPVRREVLVVGKYIAGAITAVTVFTAEHHPLVHGDPEAPGADEQRGAGGAGGDAHGGLRGSDGAGVSRLRRRVPPVGHAVPQPDRAGHHGDALGVAHHLLPCAAEEDQRHLRTWSHCVRCGFRSRARARCSPFRRRLLRPTSRCPDCCC